MDLLESQWIDDSLSEMPPKRVGRLLIDLLSEMPPKRVGRLLIDLLSEMLARGMGMLLVVRNWKFLAIVGCSKHFLKG